jgi:hypothetical protein
MKTKNIFLTLSLLMSSVAMAQAPVFTTLSSSGKDVFAGVKLQKQGMEPDTYMLQVSADKLTSTKIKLPDEILHREVIGILPAEGDQLLIMSQRTVEQGDKPLFHLYDPAKKAWKKIAEGDCTSFAKMKIETSAVTLTCVETTEKGDEVEVAKKVVLSGVKLTAPGDVILPMMKVEKENLKAELLGDVFEWSQLKVGMNKKEKIFKP